MQKLNSELSGYKEIKNFMFIKRGTEVFALTGSGSRHRVLLQLMLFLVLVAGVIMIEAPRLQRVM